MDVVLAKSLRHHAECLKHKCNHKFFFFFMFYCLIRFARWELRKIYKQVYSDYFIVTSEIMYEHVLCFKITEVQTTLEGVLLYT